MLKGQPVRHRQTDFHPVPQMHLTSLAHILHIQWYSMVKETRIGIGYIDAISTSNQTQSLDFHCMMWVNPRLSCETNHKLDNSTSELKLAQ